MLTRERNNILIVIIAVLFSGCRPDMPAQQNGDDVLVYYDYYFNNTSNPQIIDSLKSARVCYNITSERTEWEKPNEKIVKPYYTANYYDPYSKPFITGNDIIKIFPTCALPGDPLSRVNGIYFQKINKQTGEQVHLQLIVPAAELNATGPFYMSSVVTDGEHYFFSCSNNYVYCFDGNGNIVWKKNYQVAHVYYLNGYPDGYTHIYYDDHRVYFVTIEPVMGWLAVYGLDVTTGNRVYASMSVANPVIQQLLFTSKHVINFDKRAAGVMDKQTGADLGSHIALGPFANYCIPVGKVNDSLVAYFNMDRNLAYIKTGDPARHLIKILVDCPLTLFTYSNGVVYTANPVSAGIGNFTLAALDAKLINNTDVISWKKTYPFAEINSSYSVRDIKHHGNTMYYFTNFQINNNSCRPNVKIVNGASRRYLSLICVNAATGDIEKQITEIPAGLNSQNIFNIAINE